MSPSGHFARVVLLLAALAWPGSWQQIQCYTSRCGDGGLIGVDSVYECCVETSGQQFELSPTAESCLRCEVVGWREETVIATEGSSVSLLFGYRKGTPSNIRQFQVEVSGDTDYTVEPDPSNIEIGADDGNVTLHLSIHSTAEQSPSNRTVTLTLTGSSFEDVNRFIFPSEMRLIVVAVDCGDLFDPINGQVALNSTTFQSVATYECDSGFNLVGDLIRTCEANGEWNGTAPTCNPVDCGGLNNPFNGEVTFSATTFQSVATYECDSGFNLVGDMERTCQANAEWSGTAPSCNPVDCGGLIDPINGQVALNSTTFQSVATYECDSGFNLVGDMERTCQASAEWNGTAPTCNPSRVQFEHSQYSVNFSNSDAVSLCLVYDYTPALGSAVDIIFTKEDDINDVVFSRKFEFSTERNKSCQKVSIPTDKLDSKVDSVFMISIETEPDSALVLGAVSTATLTVAADGVGSEGNKEEEEDKDKEEEGSGDKGNTKAALDSGSDGSDDSWIIAVAVVVPTLLVLGAAIAAVVVVGTVLYKHSRHSSGTL